VIKAEDFIAAGERDGNLYLECPSCDYTLRFSEVDLGGLLHVAREHVNAAHPQEAS
jgi:uncharacterized C2H2 Zn-finger protein